jgi:hypothetical protein
MRAANAVDLGMLCVWTCELYTTEDLQKATGSYPALVYLVDEDKRSLLGRFAESSAVCPWGILVVPDDATFREAQAAAVRNLETIADLRDRAVAEIAHALDAM